MMLRWSKTTGRFALLLIAGIGLQNLLARPVAAQDPFTYDVAGRRVNLPGPLSYSYDLAGRCLTTKITDTAFEKSPAWPAEEPNPPLAARKAISLADQVKSTLVKDGKGPAWRLECAWLMPGTTRGHGTDDRWYWLVVYVAGSTRYPQPELRLPVLMDGTAVRPSVDPSVPLRTFAPDDGGKEDDKGGMKDDVVTSVAIRKRFDVTITADALRRSPAWRAGDANPPLAARKALALAEQQKSKLVKDGDGWTWHLHSAALVPRDVGRQTTSPGVPSWSTAPAPREEDRWYWLISYSALYHGAIFGVPPFLPVVVLMDGTVPEPKVYHWNDGGKGRHKGDKNRRDPGHWES